MHKKINILWILPFFIFLAGYYVVSYFVPKKELNTPNVIGKTLNVGINILSKQGLAIRLLREQAEANLPEGIILDQIPKSNQKIRQNQQVFVTLSRKTPAVLIPNFLGKNQKEISKKAAKLGLQPNFFWVKSNYPTNTCVFQSPCPDQELGKNQLNIFLSSGGKTMFVVPNFKGYFVNQVKQALERENVEIEIFHKSVELDGHICIECKIVDQRPLAGAIVDLSKRLYLQLQVE